jgi:hypothetical protein
MSLLNNYYRKYFFLNHLIIILSYINHHLSSLLTAVGFIPKDYSLKEQPGDGRFSMGFHSADGW